MSWPATPLRTYTAGTTPVIAAADLNALQSGQNGTINGTYSLKAVVIDGTGGAVVTPTDGTLKLGAVGSATTTTSSGSPAARPAATQFKDSICVGWCSEDRSSITGALTGLNGRYLNVYSSTRNGVGDYTVIFNYVPTDAANCCPVITPVTGAGVGSPGGSTCEIYEITTDGSGRLKVSFIRFTGVAAADGGYRIVVFGY